MDNTISLINPDAIQKESEIDDSQKIGIYEYIFVFVLIIYGGNSNTFVRSLTSTENLFAAVLPVVLSGILALKSKLFFTKQFYLLFLGLFLYFIASSFKSGSFHPYFLGYLIFCFFIAYSTTKSLKFDFFRIYEILLYYLAIISLAFWFIQTAMGSDTLYNMIGNIPNIKNFSFVTQGGLNIVLYSLQPIKVSIMYGSSIPRNCGFAWEPGAFASFISLAIFINLFLVKSDKLKTLRFWILLFALISTQSTTGYIIFSIIILFYLFQKNFQIVLLLFPVFLVALVILISLPFMGEKIKTLLTEAEYADIIVENSIGAENSRTPQRFSSFMIAFKDFQQNPILGYGGNEEARWFKKIDASVSPITGIGNLLAKYGLSGFLLFVVLLIGTSVGLANYFDYKGKMLLFLIYFLISISYSILNPLAMCFWMFAFFESTRKQELSIE